MAAEKAKKEANQSETGLTATNLQNYAKVGMSKVDPVDIRPPQVILVQKSSDISLLEDKEGNTAKVGQFYHTGKKVISDSFNCYFIFAAKGKYTDRRKFLADGTNPVLDQYQVIGVLKDMSLFGMNFRSTALYALSSLFTAAQSQNVPMFSFNLKVEAKLIKGEKGDWYVPVVRVGEAEKDNTILKTLIDMAVRLDSNAEKTISSIKEDEEDVGEAVDVPEPPRKPSEEDIGPDQIPF